MFKNNGKSTTMVTSEKLNEFTKNNTNINEYTLISAGTSAVKHNTDKIQKNFSHVTVIDSNESHLRSNQVIPNYTSILIPTPSLVGAGFQTFLIFKELYNNEELQLKILRSFSGKNKIFDRSPMGGTGNALLDYILQNTDKILQDDERLFIINPLVDNIEGIARQKYYSSIVSGQLQIQNQPNIITVHIPEEKITEFLESDYQTILDTSTANIINMKNVNNNSAKTLALEFKSLKKEEFYNNTESFVIGEIKKKLINGQNNNKKINREYFFRTMFNLLKVTNPFTLEELNKVIQQSSNYEEFKNNLIDKISQIKNMNIMQLNKFLEELLNLIVEFGYKNIQNYLQNLFDKINDKNQQVEQHNWKKTFITSKKQFLSPVKIFYSLNNLFNGNKSKIKGDLNSAVNNVNYEIRNEVIQKIIKYLSDIFDFFNTDFNSEINVELNINLDSITEITDLVISKEFEKVVKLNTDLNFSHLFFYILFKQLDNIILENYCSFDKLNSGIIVQSPLINILDISEKNLLIEKLLSRYNTRFIDIIPSLKDSSAIMKITRYCYIPSFDNIHLDKQIVKQINTNFYDFKRFDPQYFAMESSYDLLMSKLRTLDNNFTIEGEDLYYFLLYCYCLNVININKDGFSISFPNGKLKNYFDISDIQKLLKYQEQEKIRKIFITKFFEQPASFIKKLNDLNCTNNRSSRKIVNNKVLHKLFKYKLRILLKHTSKLLEMLSYLREKYA